VLASVWHKANNMATRNTKQTEAKRLGGSPKGEGASEGGKWRGRGCWPSPPPMLLLGCEQQCCGNSSAPALVLVANKSRNKCKIKLYQSGDVWVKGTPLDTSTFSPLSRIVSLLLLFRVKHKNWVTAREWKWKQSQEGSCAGRTVDELSR